MNRPKFITWIIAVIIGGVGVVATFTPIPNVTAEIAHWLVIAGFVILALATLIKGL